MIPRYAVMGNPIAHSLSPDIHATFAHQTARSLVYDKLLVELQDFEAQVLSFFQSGGRGLNITLPFKERAFKFSDIQTQRAQQAGVANTLWMHEDKLYADNTDGIGFITDIARHISIAGARVLLIGAGGAARGIVHALLDEKPKEVVVVNRSQDKAEALQRLAPGISCAPTMADVSGAFDILVNATSSGLFANETLFPLTWLQGSPFCYDLSYSKTGSTPFVLWARQSGSHAVDGYGMLVEQAAESFYIWHGVRPLETRCPG